jgi:type II secretory pathway pseudopilin PulG
MELLAVIVLVGILMTAAGMSVRKAMQLAKNTKAEAECRELVNALLEYRATVGGKWPGGSGASGEVEASANFLKPLVDPGSNDRGIVFLNLSITSGSWNDPWGNPYKVYFPGEEKPKRPAAIETCVSFPFRNTAPFLQ